MFTHAPGTLNVLLVASADSQEKSEIFFGAFAAEQYPDFEIVRVTIPVDLPRAAQREWLAQLCRAERPHIVHQLGVTPPFDRAELPETPVVISSRLIESNLQSLLLSYEKEFDARVTRAKPFRLSLWQRLKLRLYQRQMYRDWKAARFQLKHNWLIAIPIEPGANETQIKEQAWAETKLAPAHWDKNVLLMKSAGLESLVKQLNADALTQGNTIITLAQPPALSKLGTLFSTIEKLCTTEQATIVAEPFVFSFWGLRHPAHVEPFQAGAPYWAGKIPPAVANSWSRFMEQPLIGRAPRKSDLQIIAPTHLVPLPTEKTVMIFEPHSDDTFLGMGNTLQKLLLRKNRVIVVGLISTNQPNHLCAAGISSDPKRARYERDAVRRRENRRALNDLYQAVGGEKAGLHPIQYIALDLGIGEGIGGNVELAHTILELHTPGAVNVEHQNQVKDLIARHKPDLLIGIDPFDSHPDHAVSGRLLIKLAEELAAQGQARPVWLFRGFSNKREDFGRVASLVTPLQAKESAEKKRMGTDAYYSQGATFDGLYEQRLRNGWWKKSLPLADDVVESEAFIAY